MEDISKLFISLAAMCAAWAVALALTKLPVFAFLKQRSDRFGCIDGLRGYLALLVFVHHYVITWRWRTEGVWVFPDDPYIVNFGKFGVAIFFMISGYLFSSKLSQSDYKLDWYRFYKSRVFRIYPLYLCAMLVVFGYSYFQTAVGDGTGLSQLKSALLHWGIFHGAPVNGFDNAEWMLAGVEWTLRYEWMFYLLLPVFALAMQFHRNVGWLLFVIAIALLVFQTTIYLPGGFGKLYLYYFSLFVLGGIVVKLAEVLPVRDFFLKYGGSIALCSFLGAIFYEDSLSLLHVLLMTLFFIPIALGNDLFGLLKNNASILLGEVSYSIYLLHGMVLFFVFTVVPIGDSENWNLYLVAMPVVAAIVVIVAACSYIGIEAPGMKLGRRKLKLNSLNHKLP